MILFREHQKLQSSAQEILELRDEYRTYVSSLKKILHEQSEEGKKKVDEGSCEADSEDPLCGGVQEFEVVNRDPQYLKNSALAFAKEYDLDVALGKMFDTSSWDTHAQPVTRKKKKRASFRDRINEKIFHRSQALLKEEKENFVRDFIFSWPIERSNFRLSSPFGFRKLRRRGWKFHGGMDMAAMRGTPIKAAAAGIIAESGWNKGYGNYVLITHNKKYKTRYAHLRTRSVGAGQYVQRGGKIGEVGNTGAVVSNGGDGSHLHFEVYAFEKRINPALVLV